MPLDLGSLARQVGQAAEDAGLAEPELQRRLLAAVGEISRQDWVRTAERVRRRQNLPWLAGEPVEPLDLRCPAPPTPSDYTVVSTDGSHLEQDHHAALPCWLLNIGLATIRYGDVRDAVFDVKTHLGYRPEETHFVHEDRRLPLRGQLLNVRRQVEEVAALATLCEANPGAVALVDGTLILTSISRSVMPEPSYFLEEYLGHLNRIRACGSIVASYISRPSATEATSALRIGCCPLDECDRACRLALAPDRACGRLPDLLDRALFAEAGLESGTRTGLWRSAWPTSQRHYGDHEVHFFYFDSGSEVARVEVPEWVASAPATMERLQAILVAQGARGDDGYPRVLIEAHHQAAITAGDRRAFQTLLDEALAGRGYAGLLSAKARAKRRAAI